MRILFVCTGNTCRSPMAAALMRRRLDRAGREDIIVDSAGLAADGGPVTQEAAAVMREIVAVMTPAHAAALTAYGAAPEKIRLLGRGIPDPFGGGRDLYRRTRDALEQAVDILAQEIVKG